MHYLRLIVGLFFTFALSAQHTHVIPNGTANIPGSTSNNFPWGTSGSTSAGIRALACYDSANFTDASIDYPITITRLRWRANDATTAWGGGSYSQATVSLSTAAVDYSAVSTTWATNHGPDLTVCAVRRGPVVESLSAWGRCDLTESVDLIREVLQEAGVRPAGGWLKRVDVSRPGYYPQQRRQREPGYGRVIVDEVGLGAGVLDRLRELEYQAEGFNGGSSPRDGDRFANLRAQSYWVLRERLEAGELALPADERLMDELIATRWRPTPEGKVRIEAKEDLKARLGRSPDKADAVVMAVAGDAARKKRPTAGIATA